MTVAHTCIHRVEPSFTSNLMCANEKIRKKRTFPMSEKSELYYLFLSHCFQTLYLIRTGTRAKRHSLIAVRNEEWQNKNINASHFFSAIAVVAVVNNFLCVCLKKLVIWFTKRRLSTQHSMSLDSFNLNTFDIEYQVLRAEFILRSAVILLSRSCT